VARGGPINEILINVAVKESCPINKVEACYTAVLKLQNVENIQIQWCFNDKSPATYCDLPYTDSYTHVDLRYHDVL